MTCAHSTVAARAPKTHVNTTRKTAVSCTHLVRCGGWQTHCIQHASACAAPRKSTSRKARVLAQPLSKPGHGRGAVGCAEMLTTRRKRRSRRRNARGHERAPLRKRDAQPSLARLCSLPGVKGGLGRGRECLQPSQLALAHQLRPAERRPQRRQAGRRRPALAGGRPGGRRQWAIGRPQGGV